MLQTPQKWLRTIHDFYSSKTEYKIVSLLVKGTDKEIIRICHVMEFIFPILVEYLYKLVTYSTNEAPSLILFVGKDINAHLSLPYYSLCSGWLSGVVF